MAQIRDNRILLRIALVLKDLRDEKEVSQDEVYSQTNIHIGRIEAGISNPTISTLAVLIRNTLEFKFSDFFYRVETKSER